MESIPFDPGFKDEILQQDKNATLRVLTYDVAAGDRVILESAEQDEEWVVVEVYLTFTCHASAAHELLDQVNANHSLVGSEKDVYQILEPYYDRMIGPQTTVQGIVWDTIHPL